MQTSHFLRRAAIVRFSLALLASLAVLFPSGTSWAAEDAAEVERRLSEAVGYLASDELEGRGVDTQGIHVAADYLAREFNQLGLKTQLFDGGPFQKFTITTGAKLGPESHLVLVGPPSSEHPQGQRLELKLGEDFNPMAIGGSGKFDLPLVFVGYGITAKKEQYDDYDGIDVKGKAVVILRHEPQQDNPHSAFNGTKHSEYAPFARKISNAYEHGAAAVIFCTDEFDIQKTIAQHQKRWQAAVDELAEANQKFKAIENPTADDVRAHREKVNKLADDIKNYAGQLQSAADPLLPFDGAGSGGEGRNFPVLYCRRSVIDQLVKSSLGTDLATLEKQIDRGPTPKSQPLTGWSAVGETSVERTEVEAKNVLAVLEGEGPKSAETIIVGAHYDHLGWGGPGSAAPGTREIHNGADDNGSGTAVLLEVARNLARRPQKLPRRILFIAFSGEERGLLGSANYVRQPLVPLDQTIAMLNMDMVGRLKDEKLIVHGTGTAKELDSLVDRLGKSYGFDIAKKPGGFGPSDHSSFYAKQIPVLHYFTGTHSDYHRPSDDADKLNVDGMRRVGQMVTEMTVALAEADSRPEYQETESPMAGGGGGDRPYFGSIPDFAQDKPGYVLTGVTKGGPAERAGIRAGDIIVRLGESKIGNLEDFDSALRKYKAGDKVPVVVVRDQKELTLEVTLDPPR